MRNMQFPVLCLAFSLFVATAASYPQAMPQEEVDDLIYESEQAGFRITKPGVTWGMSADFGSDGNGSLSIQSPDGGNTIAIGVTVSNIDSNTEGQATLKRDEVLAQVANVETIRNSVAFEREFGDSIAMSLRVEQDSGGITFIAEQYYLASQGKLYLLQVHAPIDQFEGIGPLFGKALDSFTIIQLGGEALRDARLQALARRCGSEVAWETEWDAAATRARTEQKPIVVVVQAVSGFAVGDQVGRGAFMNPDTVQLLEHRYVVLRWRRGMGAPFESQEVFGMGPSTFGSGLLVTDSDGNVLKQLFVLQGLAVYDMLLEALQGREEYQEPVLGDELALAQHLLECGERTRAAALLKAALSSKVETGASKDLLAWLHFGAKLHTATRDGTAAREMVRAGLELESEFATRDPLARAQLEVLDVKLLTVMGQTKEAEAQVDDLIARSTNLDADSHAQALMYKGLLRFVAEDRDAAEKAWEPLLTEHSDSRWSWLIAALVTGPTWGLDYFPDLRWPAAEDIRLARSPEPASDVAARAPLSTMIAGASQFLLAEQLEDGSWPGGHSYADRNPIGNDFDLAATSIAAQALLRLGGAFESLSNVERALGWLLDQRKLRDDERTPPVVFMDYAVWSRSYELFFLSECLEQGIGDREATEKEVQRCVADLIERQQANGGWSYYLSGEVGGTALAQSISFTTATVVLALERVASIGLLSDDATAKLDRALDCLEAMRSPQQTFAYFLHGVDVANGTRASAEVEGSAARGPVCALALVRGGREDFTAMIPRLNLFVEHLPSFGAQRRKALMHAGLHTQGSHYLLYDYSTAAECLRGAVASGDIPTELSVRARASILRELRACLNQDGSFVDNPLLGVVSGTGLAIMALLDLQ
ncbi:MAG: tetratricopeptide (TPR) repeat protein [Planctomycetota bacterium]|jgi:tetratricopeptide (TPR) repeat protein